MEARLTLRYGVTALTLIAAALFAPSGVDAQDGRSRIFIPDFFYAEGTDDDFGKDVGKKLRELMDEQVKFVSLDNDEADDFLRSIDMRLRDISCLEARQLAPQVQADVVFCAHYTDVGNDMMQIDSMAFHPERGGGESFYLEPFTMDKDEDDEAAANILQQFEAFVEMSEFRAYCFEYSSLQQWEDAERNCSRSLEFNEADTGVRFQLAQIYRELERMEEALEQIDIVVEQDAFNTDALNTGGYIATQLGMKEKGLEYYKQYLTLTPDAAAVRRTIAYDMYTAGDPSGAMQLLEEGLTPDADIGIYSDYGTYAFNTAREELEARGIDLNEEGATVPADVQELYTTAIESLDRVFTELGDSSNAVVMANVVLANIQLGQFAEAEAFGRRLTQTFPDTERVWVAYAQSLQRQDKVDAALEAWTKVGEINPEYPQLYERQASLLLDSDRREDAIPLFERAVSNGFNPSTAARLLFGDAYSKGMQGDRGTNYTVEGIKLAKQFDTDAATTSMLNFFHGFARYQQGVAAAAPETLQSARASLPIFQEARQLLEGGRQYAQENNQNIAQILDAVAQYIEIQQLLIERGR